MLVNAINMKIDCLGLLYVFVVFIFFVLFLPSSIEAADNCPCGTSKCSNGVVERCFYWYGVDPPYDCNWHVSEYCECGCDGIRCKTPCCDTSCACADTTPCFTDCYNGCGQPCPGKAQTCFDTCQDCTPDNPNHSLVQCYASGTCEPQYPASCVYNPSCVPNECHVIWDTCGGTQVCPLPLTSHIDSCGKQSCGPQCGTTPTCTICDPTSFTWTRAIPFIGSLAFNWLPCGTGIASQDVYVDENLVSVTANCPGIQCVYKATGLAGATAQQTVTGLAEGTVYHYRVIEREPDCTKETIKQSISYCRLSPTSITIPLGTTATITSNAQNSNYISAVTFSSSNTARVTVNPASDTTGVNGYTTTVTGVAVGSATITANIVIGGVNDCTATATVNVIRPSPWWRVIDADVTADGELSSNIPTSCTGACAAFFGLPGTGGFPGVPLSTSSSFGSGSVSDLGWDTNTTAILSRAFNYDYFFNKLPDEAEVYEVPVGASNIDATLWNGYVNFYRSSYQYDGYYLIHSDHSLTFGTNINAGASKYILFVDGNVTINNPITVTRGSGLFMIIASGNINIGNIATGNPNLEGVYLADGTFNVQASATPLNGRGSFVGLTGVTLARDLADNSLTPAETFTYGPDQVILIPSWFYYKRIRWKEVVP